jgi:hypothetical protein
MTKTSLRTLIATVFALVLLATITGPSLAAPAQRFELPDFSLESLNACTGNLTTVTLSNRVLVIHDDVDPTGRHHLAATITENIATADGFSGRATVEFGENVVSDPLIVGEFRGFLALTNTTFTLQSDSGAVLLVHGVSHVTIPAGPVGEVKGEVEILRVECLGKPS